MRLWHFILFLAITVAGIIVGFSAWYAWDSRQNRGNEFGYYGEFNRVSNALASIPGVTITQAWHNLDVTLEEFGFSIMITGRSVTLAFGEKDPIRDMQRDQAVATLKNQIAVKLTLSTTNIDSNSKGEP